MKRKATAIDDVVLPVKGKVTAVAAAVFSRSMKKGKGSSRWSRSTQQMEGKARIAAAAVLCPQKERQQLT